MILPAGVPETNLFSFLMESSCGKQHVDSNSKPQLRWAADIQLQDLSVEGTSHLSGCLRLWECPCGRGKGRGIFLSLRPMTYIDLYWPIVLNPQKPWGGWFFLWFKAFIYIGFWCFFVGWFFQPGSVAPATGHFQLSFLEKNKTPDLKAQEAQSQHSVWLSKSLTTVCSMACAWLSWWSWAESLHQAFLMNLRKSG